MTQHRFIAKDSEALSRLFADWMVDYIKEVLARQDRFTIALSGGSTPKKLFALLAGDEYRDKIAWQRLHFFWGDERFVPFTDERNNARMTFDELLSKVPAVREQIHIMPTHLPQDEAVEEYDEILHRYFEEGGHSFDLVMLGLGDNSHTLSLFPGYDIVHENEKWVSAFFLAEQNMYRITLTAPIVNRASRVAFLVSGADKASAVKAVIAGPADPDRHPAQVIRPEYDELYWFLDEAAAAEL